MNLSECINIEQQREWQTTFKKSAKVSIFETRIQSKNKFKNHFHGYQLGTIFPLQIKNKGKSN